MKNQHGRVGVKRTRPTRKELVQQGYHEGYRAAKDDAVRRGEALVASERSEGEAFLMKLLDVGSAKVIHSMIKGRLGIHQERKEAKRRRKETASA